MTTTQQVPPIEQQMTESPQNTGGGGRSRPISFFPDTPDKHWLSLVDVYVTLLVQLEAEMSSLGDGKLCASLHLDPLPHRLTHAPLSALGSWARSNKRCISGDDGQKDCLIFWITHARTHFISTPMSLGPRLMSLTSNKRGFN